jgi:hypothetical protein
MRRSRLAILALVAATLAAGCLGFGDDAADAASEDAGPSGLVDVPPWSLLECGGTDQLAPPSGNDSCNPRTGGGPANEVTIAVHPNDPDNVVAASKDYTLGDDSECGPNRVWSGIYVSHDGGATWNHTLFDGYPGGPEDPELTGFECNTDPVLAYAPDGTLYLSGLAYGGDAADDEGEGQGSAIWVATSEDGGETWSDANVVARSSGVMVFHDKQWMAVGPDENVYVTWSAFVFPGGNAPDPADTVDTAYGAACGAAFTAGATCFTDQILASRSSDGGETWTEPTPIVEDRPKAIKQFSDPSVAPDGTVYVTWVEEEGEEGTVYLSTSTDGGQSWTPGEPIMTRQLIPGELPNSDFRMSTYPVTDVDRSHEDSHRLVMTWADVQDGDADVWYRETTDGGATWSDPVRVHTDASGNSQFLPWIDVGPEGTVHVTWMDRRHDPDNRLIDVYHAASTDGETFANGTRLTPASFDGDEGFHQSGVPFIGDYIGVAAHEDRAYVVWPDTRDADPTNGEKDGSYTRMAGVLR